MAAHNRWQTMRHSRRAPRGMALYRAVLGPPETEQPVRVGDVTVKTHSWSLPGLWPDLRWEVTVGYGGAVLHGWLVRSPDAAVPDLPRPERLAPWSCVVNDTLARFPGARQADPNTASQWVVHVDGHQLWFVYGLLQTVKPDA